MDIEQKILFVLSEHTAKGLGYNELTLAIPEKSLRKYLPNHIKNGFVRVEKIACRGGKKHLHFLTEAGHKQLKIMRTKESLIDNVYRLSHIRSLKQKLELFSELISDITILGIEELGYRQFEKEFIKAITLGLELGTKTMELKIYLDFLRERKTFFEKNEGHEEELSIITNMLNSLEASG